VYTREAALATYSQNEKLEIQNLTPSIFYTRLFLAFWTLGILVYMVVLIGVWPFASYTMISWTLLTVRNLSILFGWFNVATVLRFPSLVQNTVTVTIWWLVLVPLIYYMTSPEQREGFTKWNGGFFLVNVHLLNLFIATLDCYLAPRILTMADLWISVLVAFIYLMFYLLILDPKGLHFYVILSPRTHLCMVVHAVVLGLYYGLFCLWNIISVKMIEG